MMACTHNAALWAQSCYEWGQVVEAGWTYIKLRQKKSRSPIVQKTKKMWRYKVSSTKYVVIKFFFCTFSSQSGTVDARKKQEKITEWRDVKCVIRAKPWNWLNKRSIWTILKTFCLWRTFSIEDNLDNDLLGAFLISILHHMIPVDLLQLV